MPECDLIDSSGDMGLLLETIRTAPMPGLNELPRCSQTAASIKQLSQSSVLLEPTLEAGLWLLAGDLGRSHSISQALNTPEGSLWHAIMHRREGDYWNAKYWFRRAKEHPVYAGLADQVCQAIHQSPEFLVGNSTVEVWTNPSLISEELVDSVEQAVRNQNDWQAALQRVCWWEWQLLFLHCWRMRQEPQTSFDFQN